MILDGLFGGWLVLSGLIGFRDGSVRKLVSAVMCIVGLVVGSIFMGDAAKVLVEKAAIDPSDGPFYGYLIVFFGVMIAQALVYKFASGSYKIGGLADRIGGAALGALQGALFLSVLLYILAMRGWPSQSMKEDSQIYRSIVNVAPQILDAVLTTAPESVEELKQIAAPEKAEVPASRPEATAKDLRETVRQRSRAASRSIDSLRSSLRR